MEGRVHGAERRRSPETPLGVWQGEFTKLRVPNLYNLRSDPFERGTESIYYGDWMAHRMFVLVPAQAFVGQGLESFKEFPPREKPASFNLDDVMGKIKTASRRRIDAGRRAGRTGNRAAAALPLGGEPR